MDTIEGLETWLAPFLAVLGRKTRRNWAPLYVQGLIGPGEAKSMQPMAQRLGLPGHNQFHHFLTSPVPDQSGLGRHAVVARVGHAGGPTDRRLASHAGRGRHGAAQEA